MAYWFDAGKHAAGPWIIIIASCYDRLVVMTY